MIYYSALRSNPSTKIWATKEFNESICGVGIGYLRTDKFQDNPMSIKLSSIGLANTPFLYQFTTVKILATHLYLIKQTFNI